MSLADAMRRAIAGSSGPFYASALMRAAHALPDSAQPADEDWDRAFAAGIGAVSDIGGAKAGDRTMVDALAPALAAWQAARQSGRPLEDALAAAATAAREGAEATSEMSPKLGRASYLGDRALGHADGGAVAVAIWMAALAGKDASGTWQG
jgi:dihydroxyacetone kinase